jgi:alkylation response protein AidB-like acyl-CoA dehydrogenase
MVEQAIYAEEMARLGLPRQSNITSLELAGPMIYTYGTDRQRTDFLQAILTGEHIWTQMFSEPGAGSDLASISTRAVRHEDGWRVTGQKIWSSGGHYADLALLLARTSGEGHRGITCFLLPTSREGVTIRPIVQLNGEQKFSETFLDDVWVGEADVLGEVDGGWKVAMSTLGRERLTLGSHSVALRRSLHSLAGHPHAVGAPYGPRFAELWARIDLLRLTWFRFLSSDMPVNDPRASVLKLLSSELDRDIALFGSLVLGPDLATCAKDASNDLLVSLSRTIAGGTTEIQKNIIAERILGLPREPRAASTA